MVFGGIRLGWLVCMMILAISILAGQERRPSTFTIIYLTLDLVIYMYEAVMHLHSREHHLRMQA